MADEINCVSTKHLYLLQEFCRMRGQHQWDRSSYSTVGKRRAAEQAGAVVFLGWIPCQVYPRFAWLLTMIMILESGPDLE